MKTTSTVALTLAVLMLTSLLPKAVQADPMDDAMDYVENIKKIGCREAFLGILIVIARASNEDKCKVFQKLPEYLYVFPTLCNGNHEFDDLKDILCEGSSANTAMVGSLTLITCLLGHFLSRL